MALFLPSFGFGSILMSGILVANSIAVLSQDRFLQRVGMTQNAEPAFGAPQDSNGLWAKTVRLIYGVQTVTRCTYKYDYERVMR